MADNRIDSSSFDVVKVAQEDALALKDELKVIQMEVKSDSLVSLISQGKLSLFNGLSSYYGVVCARQLWGPIDVKY
ncbi:hypothetical protein [Candidatus Similichlamydia epinepheli]|uniref:hypothetical protein n=1 Tax=Candidatus Similichlamydia epinepheli TaxID=1903953 RepID=UPI0018640C0F|nr:hypothetical protein [Candidatus Similichlamydia epinepheli]